MNTASRRYSGSSEGGWYRIAWAFLKEVGSKTYEEFKKTMGMGEKIKSLACACHDRDTYPILVYEIPTGELRGKFTGHFGLVYDLCWSKRDTHLLSASADGTCR
ncbi:hypothetical protein KUTeg_016939 [Tegillarca granosa]|uniref:Uncharacterized protein n=1 Tax=Tegillarca granosa TaxID=220873 RepID=A0ABQ9EM98_TEGGR|nr:hypothetical protein KUTeg_016939 [Tegillarca granosa]